VLDPSRNATVAQAPRQPIRKTKSMLDTAQLQNALVRRQHPAVKSDTHLLARSLETPCVVNFEQPIRPSPANLLAVEGRHRERNY
jgi:hypothetical protein